MSTEVIVAPPKPVTLQQRALVAIGDRDEAQLQKLADGTKDITTITNDDGYKQIQSARIVLKNERIAIEKDGKKAREDATAFGKAVIKEEDRLIAIISPEEKRLQKLQDDWDAEIERIRQEKINEELKRVADLQERVTELRGNMLLSPTSGAALIAEHIADLERIEVSDSFQEFQQQALDAKESGLSRLRSVYTAAVAHEAEQARIKVEREELARFREAEAFRVAQDNARRAEEERAAKVARDAETARHNEQLRSQREEQETAAKVERMRIADQAEAARKLVEAEDKRLAAERAELARQQEELRKVQEPPKPAVTRRGVALPVPSGSEIVGVLAKHYRAHPETVIDWLQQIDFTRVEAA